MSSTLTMAFFLADDGGIGLVRETAAGGKQVLATIVVTGNQAAIIESSSKDRGCICMHFQLVREGMDSSGGIYPHEALRPIARRVHDLAVAARPQK